MINNKRKNLAMQQEQVQIFSCQKGARYSMEENSPDDAVGAGQKGDNSLRLPLSTRKYDYILS